MQLLHLLLLLQIWNAISAAQMQMQFFFFFFLIENVTNRMNNLKESGQIVMKPMKTS